MENWFWGYKLLYYFVGLLLTCWIIGIDYQNGYPIAKWNARLFLKEVIL